LRAAAGLFASPPPRRARASTRPADSWWEAIARRHRGSSDVVAVKVCGAARPRDVRTSLAGPRRSWYSRSERRRRPAPSTPGCRWRPSGFRSERRPSTQEIAERSRPSPSCFGPVSASFDAGRAVVSIELADGRYPSSRA
jgi:hypothetical protein